MTKQVVSIVPAQDWFFVHESQTPNQPTAHRVAAWALDKRYTPGELAQKVTYDQLSEDGDKPFAVWCALRSKLVKHRPPKMPSWPLYFRGFEYDIRETILDWAKFSGANGVPMTTGEVVRGMTFMMIDDDEGFRAWRLARGRAVQ